MFSNHVYKIIILPTLVIRIPNLEIFLFCQHNSTGGGNLELRQTIHICHIGWFKMIVAKYGNYVKLTQVAKNQFGFATAILWH
jgi:hypothetical protein